MSIDPILCVIISGFMCICGGFGSYGCYRCFTDRARSARSRVHSEYSQNKKYADNKRRKSSGSSASDSSFNGTIYTISSLSSRGSGQRKMNLDSNVLKNNHNYALSINPTVVSWTLRDELKGRYGDTKRAFTAPT